MASPGSLRYSVVPMFLAALFRNVMPRNRHLLSMFSLPLLLVFGLGRQIHSKTCIYVLSNEDGVIGETSAEPVRI